MNITLYNIVLKMKKIQTIIFSTILDDAWSHPLYKKYINQSDVLQYDK